MPTYNFTLEELAVISKLPPQFVKLREKYPLDILNAASVWSKPPLSPGTQPELIEVYYNDDSPAIIFIQGVLKKYTPKSSNFKANSIAVQIDDEWAYIELEGQEIINRIEGLVLPEVIANPAVVMEAVIALFKA